MADKLGTFYGVGVGPGDPELLTLKAVRVLESCPVLAAPQMASGEMTALSIARQAARLEGKTLLPLRFTMSRDRAEQAEGHRRAADAVRPYLEAGQDVAMAILGDVSIYSTYCYMMELLKAEGFPCVMVPGVPSFCAVAARLGRAGPASPHHPRRRPGAGRGAGPAGEQGADEGGQEPPEAAGGAGGPEAAGPGGYGGELRPAGGAAFCGSHGET